MLDFITKWHGLLQTGAILVYCKGGKWYYIVVGIAYWCYKAGKVILKNKPGLTKRDNFY